MRARLLCSAVRTNEATARRDSAMHFALLKARIVACSQAPRAHSRARRNRPQAIRGTGIEAGAGILF